ncbi:hypothetical protein E2C01_063221 [Portunus trituberculatus]|uniref:Uncharacterized protein n=1 Tax=Portunus trituberculatus TaxID=210409 RepID=A0A5B7HJP7_PORTR|nr:hypothetical protein [Portunus trituberculatus]
MKEQPQQMKEQSQELRQAELRGISEKRCACAEEKHREGPISEIHCKEEVVEDQEEADAPVRAVHSFLVLGAGAAFQHPPSPLSSEDEDHRSSRSSLPFSRANRKLRKPREFNSKVPWEAYQAQFELLAPPRYERGTDALPRHVKARRVTTCKTNHRWKD